MDDSLECFVEKLKVKRVLGIKRDHEKGASKRRKLSRTKKGSNNKYKDSINPLSEITCNIVDSVLYTTKVESKYFKKSENCSALTEKGTKISDIDQISSVKKEEIVFLERDKENTKPLGLARVICLPSVNDFAKPEEPKENVQLYGQEVITEDNLERIITFKKETLETSLECEKSEMNLVRPSDADCNVPIVQSVAQSECPVCSKMVEEHSHAQHVRDCFMNKFERNTCNSRFCELCGKDISHMNQQRQLQHVNHCLDRQKQIADQPGPNQFCPICGTRFKTEDQRILHLKRCSRKVGIEPGKLVQASKLLEKQLAEIQALGLPAIPLRVNKTSPKRRRFAAVPQSNAEADMQMALALSASLEKEDDWQISVPPIKGHRRKKGNRLPDCLLPLVLQTETDRLKLLENKVAQLIFPNFQECENLKSERSFDDGKADSANLWAKTCTLETDNFYLTELQDFITQKVVKIPLLNEHIKPSEENEVIDYDEDTGRPSCSEKAEGFYAVDSEINEGFGDTPRTLASDMKKLLGKSYLSDLTIHTSDGSVPAHKLILAARCPKVLEPDFSVQELQWLDVSSAAVFAFLECIYTGVFTNAEDIKHQILKLAYKFGAQELFHEYQRIDIQRKDDGVFLDKDEIREISQHTQSQQHQFETKPSNTTLSDIEIVDHLINEDDVEEVYMYMSQQQQKNAASPLDRANCPQTHCSERPSSPDLFDIGDDPVSPIEKLKDQSLDLRTKDIFNYSFSEALATSSPMKSFNKAISESGTCKLTIKTRFAKSPFKKVSDFNAIETKNQNICNAVNDSTSAKTVLNSPEEVFEEPLSFESNIKATVHSLRQSLKFSSSPIQSSSEMINGVNISRSPISPKTLSPKYNKLEPYCYKESSISPMKNERKRSLEDCEWKTPKRQSLEKQISPKLQKSFSQKGNDSLLDDPDVWAAFEDECCVEMVETPKMLKTSLLGKIEDNKSFLGTSSRKSEQHCFTQKPRNSNLTHLPSLTQPDPVRVSNSQRIVTPKAKNDSNQIPLQKKVYDQVTPLPDYRKMITPELKEALKKYGVRKLPRSKAVALLNHIYELTHPWAEDSEKPSTSKLLSSKISLTQVESPKKNVEMEKILKLPKQKTKKTIVTSKATRNRIVKNKTQTQQKFAIENKSQDELSSSQNSSIGDMPEESIGEVIAANSSVKESIKKYILEDTKLYEKILLYEPIPVNDLHQELKHNQITITMAQLMDFLDEECITFSLPRSANYKKKQQARSQRFRKRVVSKLSKDL